MMQLSVGEPSIRARRSNVAPDCEFGPGVEIEADELDIQPGCRIGFSDGDDFRTPPGVRISVRRLRLGAGVQVGRSVAISGGDIALDEGVRVLRNSTVRVTESLIIGAYGTLNEGCEVSGRHARIGQELWMLPGAKIGGGSAFESDSSLETGHYVHVGVDSLINTARPVTIGHEVGLGTRTSIYTHGAYPSALMGFPVAFDGVSIGDFSWVPGAIINPGVRIGRNCVVGVNSLVTKSLPDGCLAAGSPAKVIKEDAYPRVLSADEQLEFYSRFFEHYARLLRTDGAPAVDAAGRRVTLSHGTVRYVAGPEGTDLASSVADGGRVLAIGAGLGTELGGELPAGATLFDTQARRIRGAADAASQRLANELRRHGIRFYSRETRTEPGRYVDWEAQVPQFLASDSP
jgi:acetyltransferase-like isoleucine patch superfamily enzyme